MQSAQGNCLWGGGFSALALSFSIFGGLLLKHMAVERKKQNKTKTVFTRRMFENHWMQRGLCEEKLQDHPWLIPTFPEVYTPCFSLHFRGKIAQ